MKASNVEGYFWRAKMKAVMIEGEKTNSVQKILCFILKQNLVWDDTKFEAFTKISKDGEVKNEVEF